MPSDVTVVQPWTYQVVIPLTGHDVLSRLQKMDSWLTEWEVTYQIGEVDGSVLNLCFATGQLAHAFAETFGLLPPSEVSLLRGSAQGC